MLRIVVDVLLFVCMSCVWIGGDVLSLWVLSVCGMSVICVSILFLVCLYIFYSLLCVGKLLYVCLNVVSWLDSSVK